MEKMTTDCEAHLAQVKDRFLRDVDMKYRKGQREHGGRLWMKPAMTKMMRDEVVDFVVYSDVIDEQLRRIVELLEQGKVGEAHAMLVAMLDGEPD